MLYDKLIRSLLVEIAITSLAYYYASGVFV